MLPRDIPDCPWQDIAVDYMTHKSHEYLIICSAFSKYPFVYKVMAKSATSLCMRLLELTSQYGPPMSLSTDNDPPFASEDHAEFLMHHSIAHHTSSPYFPRSNGFIERQARTIKTALNTALPANKPLATALLDLRSMPIGPKMPSLCEILHNRSIQWPGRPSQPINMEQVRNFLISHRQAQCDQFNKAHRVQALPELPPGQEVLFKSQADNEYIPGTISEKAPALQSYIIEAQGKKYCRTREHVWPIHFNLPPPQQSADSHRQQCFARPSPQAHKQLCFPGPCAQPHSPQAISRPSPPKSLIPRPAKGNPSLARPSVLARPPLPHHLGKLSFDIPWPPGVNKGITVFPSEEDLLQLSTLVPLPNICTNQETWMPGEPCSAPTTPSTPREELEAESQTLWTAKPVLPHTHFAPGCLSPTTRQPSASYKGDHRLSYETTCPYPSPATVSAVQTTLMATPLWGQMTLMAPLQKSRQIHHAYR